MPKLALLALLALCAAALLAAGPVSVSAAATRCGSTNDGFNKRIRAEGVTCRVARRQARESLTSEPRARTGDADGGTYRLNGFRCRFQSVGGSMYDGTVDYQSTVCRRNDGADVVRWRSAP